MGGPLKLVQQWNESDVQVREQEMSYGAEGELLQSGGWGEPVRYAYDADYRVTSLRDGNAIANAPNASATFYNYNLDGELLKARYPRADGSGDFDTLSYSYFADHSLSSVRDGRGLNATYTRNDPEGLLTAVSYDNGRQSENATYSYDGWGLPASVNDGAVSETYAFNAADSLQSVSTQFRTPQGTLSVPYTLNYAYYADGSRSGMTTPGGSFGTNYDAAGRLASLTNPQSISSTWNYLDNDWLQSQSNGGRIVTRYAHNALGQLLGVKNLNNAGDTLSQFGHVPDAGQAFNPQQVLAYDGAMNLVRRVVDVPDQPSLNHTSNYSYDGRDQLGGETVARPDASLNVARTWNYDAVGNPTAGSNTPATGPASTWTRTFNSANQETTLGWNEATQAFDKTLYAYDGNGNPTLYRGLNAAYDARNRLTAWGRMQSGYRSDGKRAWKATLDNDGNETSRKYFLYDGDNLLCELDEVGRVTSTSTWGGNGLLSRAVTAYAQDGTPSTSTVFYGYDERGSVSERVSDNGTSVGVAHVSYDTWGAGSAGDSVGFGGQFGYYTDGETGLVLCTHRFYDPSTQRWMTRDPISYDGGVNVYGYVGNNPVNTVDPTGLLYREIGGIVGGVAGGLLGGGPLGVAVGNGLGSFVGSLLDGDCLPQATRNGLADGVVSIVGAGLFGGGMRVGQLANRFKGGALNTLVAGAEKTAMRGFFKGVADSPQLAKSLARYNGMRWQFGNKIASATSPGEIMATLEGPGMGFSKGAAMVDAVKGGFQIQGSTSGSYAATAATHELTHLGAMINGQAYGGISSVAHEMAVNYSANPVIISAAQSGFGSAFGQFYSSK